MCYWLQYLLLLISCRLLICILLILNCFAVFSSVSVADGIKTLTLMGKALMALHAYCLIFFPLCFLLLNGCACQFLRIFEHWDLIVFIL